VHEQVLEIVAERGQRGLGGEVFLLLRPLGNRVDDAADQLLDRAFALGGPDVAPEIFRDNDIGRLLRPGLRHFHAALFEYNGALFVANDGVAQFPFDLVEGIGAGGREESRELETGGGLGLTIARGVRTFGITC